MDLRSHHNNGSINYQECQLILNLECELLLCHCNLKINIKIDIKLSTRFGLFIIKLLFKIRIKKTDGQKRVSKKKGKLTSITMSDTFS